MTIDTSPNHCNCQECSAAIARRILEAEHVSCQEYKRCHEETLARAEKAEAEVERLKFDIELLQAFLIGHHVGRLAETGRCPNCRGGLNLTGGGGRESGRYGSEAEPGSKSESFGSTPATAANPAAVFKHSVNRNTPDASGPMSKGWHCRCGAQAYNYDDLPNECRRGDPPHTQGMPTVYKEAVRHHWEHHDRERELKAELAKLRGTIHDVYD